MKTCCRCRTAKPMSDFHRCPDHKDGRQSHCKECERQRDRSAEKKMYHQQHRSRRVAYLAEWRERNSATMPARLRRYALLRKYGITPDDFDRILESQGGVCAICRRPERTGSNGAAGTLRVDHCHDSGMVRGLLCNACNTAIGFFEEDTDAMAVAIAYLKAHADTKTRVG